MSVRARIFCEKAENLLPRLPDACFDSIVVDPPYGLAEIPAAVVVKALTAWLAGDRMHVPDGKGFMGREWDKFVPPPGIWDECFRVLKPGGYLLAFAAPRTADLMGLSIRLAGFEVRDSLHWLMGSGFPKSLNVSKAIDKAAGVEREVVGRRTDGRYASRFSDAAKRAQGATAHEYSAGWIGDPAEVTVPATDAARQWEGWGTALKPAHEPIVMARKPLSDGTVAANVLRWGTGALNVGGCKVQHANGADLAGYAAKCAFVVGLDSNRNGAAYGEWSGAREDSASSEGRWPPNLLLTHSADCQPAGTRRVKAGNSNQGSPRAGKIYGDAVNQDGPSPHYAAADGMETMQAWDCAPGCPVAEMDAQSGNLPARWGSGAAGRVGGNEVYGAQSHVRNGAEFTRGDSGGASRFFPQFVWDPESDVPFLYQAKAPKRERPRIVTDDGRVIQHCTVKPVALCRWLVRLVTPPGGTVGDFFCGTGPVVQAALEEGMRCVACDQDPDSVALARVRLASYAGVKFTVPEPAEPEPAEESS